MKIMDDPMGSNECTITVALPPKKKKLVQALLPFQLLGSSATPNSQITKKRKYTSPSPTGCRSPKIVKIAPKENSAQKTITETIGDDKESKDINNSEETKADTIIIGGSSDENMEEWANDESFSTEKKIDTDTQMKPGAIMRFLHKVSKETTPTRKYVPRVVLIRCDDKGSNSTNLDHNCSRELNMETVEKLNLIKSDDSSNEELAKELENTDTDDDIAEKERSDASSDNHAINSDSDSEQGISSTEDETDEQKTKKDDETQDKNMVNGKSLDKTPTSSIKSDNTSAARKKLTPKQLEKKMKSSQRREQQRVERLEKEKKRKEEKLVRLKEKEARRREKKEKEESEKEQKRKEKEQKDLKKQMETELKQKEKERREKAKEEDRRKREEDKLEAERKKHKAATTFVSFFVPKKSESKPTEEVNLVRKSNFMPFEVKADMRVAPICRRTFTDTDKMEFDSVCIDKLTNKNQLYIAEINTSEREVRKSGKTWPPNAKEDEIVVIEDDDVGSCNMVDQNSGTIERHRAKLLSFAENRRPPYWGTWRKKSSQISSRRPFSKDGKWFDYEVDSDEEWEEEEPGESLRGSDDEKDEENPDDNEYDVDNEFMVPHGYLSDEEAQADDEDDITPEIQKSKLKILGDEFEKERKEKTLKIKPKVIGCIWQGPVNSYPEDLREKLVDFFMARQAWVREIPIELTSTMENTRTAGDVSGTPKSRRSIGDERRGAKKTVVPDEALPDLIRLIHGNTHSRSFLIKEFMIFWNRKNGDSDKYLSKSSVNQKVTEFAKRMACPEEGPMHLKWCWYVSEEVRKQYFGEEGLELPNRWKYLLSPKRQSLTEPAVNQEKLGMEENEKGKEKEMEKEKKSVPLITQYTKKITQEEMKKQLTTKPSQVSSGTASTSQVKPAKRAQLISVPRSEQFPKSPIINAFSKGKSTLNLKQGNPSRSSTNPIEISGNEPVSTSTSDKIKTEKIAEVTPVVIDLELADSNDCTTE